MIENIESDIFLDVVFIVVAISILIYSIILFSMGMKYENKYAHIKSEMCKQHYDKYFCEEVK